MVDYSSRLTYCGNRQPAARVSHLDPKKFPMARRDPRFVYHFVMIYTEGILTLTCIKICVVGALNDLKPQGSIQLPKGWHVILVFL